MARKVGGAFLAPIVPALAVAVMGLVRVDLEMAAILFVVALAAGYVIELTTAWPMLTWLSRHGQLGLINVVIVGAVSTLVAIGIFVAIVSLWIQVDWIRAVRNLAAFAIPFAMLGAWTLWYVVYRKAQPGQ